MHNHLIQIFAAVSMIAALTACQSPGENTAPGITAAADSDWCYIEDLHMHPENLTQNNDRYKINCMNTGFVGIYKDSGVKDVTLTDITLTKEQIYRAMQSPEDAADFLLQFDTYNTGYITSETSEEGAREKIIEKLCTENDTGYTKVSATHGIYEISLMRRFYFDEKGKIQTGWDPEDAEVYITGITTVYDPEHPESFTMTLDDGVMVHLSEIKGLETKYITDYFVTFFGKEK